MCFYVCVTLQPERNERKKERKKEEAVFPPQEKTNEPHVTLHAGVHATACQFCVV